MTEEERKAYKAQWYLDNKERLSARAKERYRKANPLKPKEVLPDGYKRCSKCKEVLPTERFSKSKKVKDGLKPSCKSCRQKEYLKSVGKDKLERFPRPEGMTKKEYNQMYYQQNKERIKENSKKSLYRRMEEDVGFLILQRCRKRLYDAVKGCVKSDRTIRLIGCHPDELVTHLEKQFEEGMTWENYGEWHIDHIKPCALFDFTKEEHQRKCFHYSNLQPLWAEDNLSKGARYEES